MSSQALDGVSSEGAAPSTTIGSVSFFNLDGDSSALRLVPPGAAVVNNSTIGGQVSSGNYNLCTTLVTNMSQLFEGNTNFNSNISFWDTSNVTNMSRMFKSAQNFNQNIGNWDVSNVTIV